MVVAEVDQVEVMAAEEEDQVVDPVVVYPLAAEDHLTQAMVEVMVVDMVVVVAVALEVEDTIHHTLHPHMEDPTRSSP